MRVLCFQIWKVQPREFVFEGPPHPFHRIQLGRVWWQQHQTDIFWKCHAFGRVRTTGIHDQDVQRVGIGVRERVHKDLNRGTVEPWALQKKMLTRGWGDRTIYIEALERMLDQANGLHTACSQAATPYGQPANATLILRKHLDRTLVGGATYCT